MSRINFPLPSDISQKIDKISVNRNRFLESIKRNFEVKMML